MIKMPKIESRLSIYFPQEMIREVSGVAHQLQRPRSWVLQQAWAMTRDLVKKKSFLYKERWKNDFVDVVGQISQRTKPLSNKYIEDFAVEEVKKYRKAKHNK